MEEEESKGGRGGKKLLSQIEPDPWAQSRSTDPSKGGGGGGGEGETLVANLNRKRGPRGLLQLLLIPMFVTLAPPFWPEAPKRPSFLLHLIHSVAVHLAHKLAIRRILLSNSTSQKLFSLSRISRIMKIANKRYVLGESQHRVLLLLMRANRVIQRMLSTMYVCAHNKTNLDQPPISSKSTL
jgi:hypothetical protein